MDEQVFDNKIFTNDLNGNTEIYIDILIEIVYLVNK